MIILRVCQILGKEIMKDSPVILILGAINETKSGFIDDLFDKYTDLKKDYIIVDCQGNNWKKKIQEYNPSKKYVIFISQASFLEMSIKMSLGKLKLPVSWSDLLYYCERGGIHILPIETFDSIMLSNLLFHHRDPFDRILICQALNRQYSILSKDGLFEAYGVLRMWD